MLSSRTMEIGPTRPMAPNAPSGVAQRLSPAPAQPDEMLSRRTELVLKELEGLPTLPAVAAKLLQIGANEDVDVKEVVRVIESDPSLTIRLLSLCKRAAYRTRNPITTVEMAVVMLGVEAVRSLVLSVAIFDWTNSATEARRGTGEGAVGSATAKGRNSTKPGMGSASGANGVGAAGGAGENKASFNRVGFWQHSIAVACCCELIAREHPDLEFHAEEAFVCGLTHDIGKLALELVLPRAYARVIELADSRQGNIAEYERPIVGLDHHTAGAKLAEKWGLPPLVCEAIAQHHTMLNDVAPEHRRLIGLVQLADLICRKLALGWSGNFAVSSDERELCLAAGFNYERVMTLVPKLYEQASARMRDLGLGDEPSQGLLIESILRANQRLGRVNQDLLQANMALEHAQKQLTETRALARLGQMTAGAAHEMNNPLTVISGRAQALSGKLKDDQDRATARSIVDAASRLTNLITRLHRIATPPKPEPAVVELREVMESIVRSAKDRHGDNMQRRGEKLTVIGIKLTMPEGIEPARIDVEMLRDAMSEIIVNALEAGPRGRVEVRVGIDEHDDRLMIQVSDDGAGMSPHALDHAMDPFFSEKAAGRQTGLGLALAHRLIAAQGGEIDLQSKPGRGTTVSVYLGQWRAGKDARVGRMAA